jgi:hypothetical protein
VAVGQIKVVARVVVLLMRCAKLEAVRLRGVLQLLNVLPVVVVDLIVATLVLVMVVALVLVMVTQGAVVILGQR